MTDSSYTATQEANSRISFSLKLLLLFALLVLDVFLINFLGIEKDKGFNRAALLIGVAVVPYLFVPIQFKKIYLLVTTLALEIFLFGFKLGIGAFAILLIFTFTTYIDRKWLRNLVSLLLVLISVYFVSMAAIGFVRLISMLGFVFIMLRYIYLLYEINYFKTPPSFVDRLTYLFMLPNACFPLFPVVDPKIYFTQFYTSPFKEHFQKGLVWITRGIWHTLLYRIIYFFLTPSPYEVYGFWTWLFFIFSAYSLILRLSGLFYMSLGFLQLFGFNLPLIFDHYFFASGFADLWKRANLYWRAFMTRVFYYSLLFKLKKLPMKFALFATTLFMFFVTWALHAWQWYWIKGKMLLNPNDMLFWALLGTAISVNAVIAYSRIGKPPKKEGTIDYFKKTCGIMVMFFSMSFLWSLWTSSSIKEFFYLTSFIGSASVEDWIFLLIGFIGIGVIGGFIRYLHLRKNYFSFVFKDANPVWSITMNLVILAVFLFPPSFLVEEFSLLKDPNLNKRDRQNLERGYYEQILSSDDKARDVFNFDEEHVKWNADNKAYTPANNILIKEFIPDFITTFKGDTIQTNSFGIRDKEYALEKDSQTVRIAILGGSYEMGAGVSNSENYSALVEEKLNSGFSNFKVEVLNYGAGGYHLPQAVYLSDHKVMNHRPDYVFYFAHSDEQDRCIENLVNVIEKDLPLTYPFLDSICKLAGIEKNMCRLEKTNRLKQYTTAIYDWCLQRISSLCRSNNAIPVLVFLPSAANYKSESDRGYCLGRAASAGMECLDLYNVYEGQKQDQIQLSSWDTHPNEKGHRIISEKLFTEMSNKKALFKFLK
jgi:hypothetical protein